ncbi:MAG: dap4 3, partial [Phycisphaerales bacterium]|nr:dap4 3 [Phycisphaerales bacterium]
MTATTASQGSGVRLARRACGAALVAALSAAAWADGPATRQVAATSAATAPAERRVSPPRVYRDRVEPNWLPGGTRFWYRNDLRGGAREFVLVDAAAGTRAPAFDHAKAAAAWADGPATR